MLKYVRWLFVLVAALLIASVPHQAGAQPDNVNFRFNSGQPIQPIYEGWRRNPDNTIAMYFGYINRNYAQHLSIPLGAANSFAPGPIDRGQPTFFYTRIRRQAFSVKLPASWGKTDELIWTVTANGTTLKAVGWMQPEWEIDPLFDGQAMNEERRANKAPMLTVDAPGTGSRSAGLVLNAMVTDDDLPKPRPKRGAVVGQESPPSLQALPDQFEIPVNVPEAVDPGRGTTRTKVEGLRVSWIVWRGPAHVTFDPGEVSEVRGGQSIVTATFSEPGTYVLRARASDGALPSVEKDVTVTVTP
jgi:hypothetical protein